jgi:2-dehydropantoate 2-reductase
VAFWGLTLDGITGWRRGREFSQMHNPNDGMDGGSVRIALDQKAGSGQSPCLPTQHLAVARSTKYDEDTIKEPVENIPTIHILGLTPIGKLVAHSIASLANDRPSIVYLEHRPWIRRLWTTEGQAIEVVKGGSSTFRAGIRFEPTPPYRSDLDISLEKDPLNSRHNPPTIDHLVLATPTIDTTRALFSLKDRLGPSSTICFLQNAMGLIDEVNEMVFPDFATRPRYMIASTSHGVVNHTSRSFSVVQHGTVDMYLCLVPHSTRSFSSNPDGRGVEVTSKESTDNRMIYSWNSSARTLLKIFTRLPNLTASGVEYPRIFREQLQRLAVAAVIGPLSVIFDCRNGGLLFNHEISELMRDLLREICLVIRYLPELEGQPISGILDEFSAERFQQRVTRIASQTRQDMNNMLRDVTNGRKSEIDYINGYIVKRGEELGINCSVNRSIILMVKAKGRMKEKEKSLYIPFEKAED